MSIIDRWRDVSSETDNRLRLWVLYGRDMASYILACSLPDDEALEIQNPLAPHYLNELALEGRVQQRGETYSLPWGVIYQLLANKEEVKAISVLELPPHGDLTPALRSENTLNDGDFAIAIDGWFINGALLGSVELTGPVAHEGSRRTLLRQEVFALVRAIQDFYGDTERNPQSNRKHWGRIRHLAMLAGARMDQFLHDTIVVTPEKLHIRLVKTDIEDIGIVEVQPWFLVRQRTGSHSLMASVTFRKDTLLSVKIS